MSERSVENEVEVLGDLIAKHDAYHVNEDGWTVCICGHVAEGDDDDGSHARHVAAVIGGRITPKVVASIYNRAGGGWSGFHAIAKAIGAGGGS